MYQIKQTETKKSFFNLIKRNETKVYKFRTFNEALKFAAHEQINTFEFIKDGKKTIHRTYKYIYRLNKWIDLATNNPIHYINRRYFNGLNLEKYYFVLIERNINKLLKNF